jgi:hypothetical protein
MNRQDTDLRAAATDAWTTTRITGGHLLRVGSLYVDRCGLAFDVLRGRQPHHERRTLIVTAVVAGASGAIAVLVAGLLSARRRSSTVESDVSPSQPAATEESPATWATTPSR